MAGIRVRRARPKDADAIAELALEVQDWHVAGRPDLFKPGGCDTAAEIAARIESVDQFYWVALLDTDVVGYAFARVQEEPETRWRRSARILVLDQMGVAARHRRRGAGVELWNAVRKTAETGRVERIVLNVWSFNAGAREFYERIGFTPFYERIAVELRTRGADQVR